MSQLNLLRRKLARLRRTRQSQRWIAAHSAWLTAVLVALAAVFVLDFLFSLNVPQRVAVMVVAAVGVVWAFGRYTAPLLGVRESEIDLALQVERRQRISSDLVAALQFEERSASAVGSPRLRQAVIEGTASRSQRLNVHDGFDSGSTVRRVAWLILAVAGSATFIGVFPEYARVFGQRLALGATHYPSWTQIRTIGVSGMPVLENAEHPTPRDVRLAEGLPLEFLVRVTGRLPQRGEARLVSGPSDASRVLELEPLSLNERRLRLEDAQARIQAAQEDPQIDVVGPWAAEVAALLR
ncbi:MAG: hypothetical protein KDA55_02030 [Planctomycetales bacterium]|nr:hypothetical protein [Planctomycetales bacterium]